MTICPAEISRLCGEIVQYLHSKIPFVCFNTFIQKFVTEDFLLIKESLDLLQHAQRIRMFYVGQQVVIDCTATEDWLQISPDQLTEKVARISQEALTNYKLRSTVPTFPLRRDSVLDPRQTCQNIYQPLQLLPEN